MAVACVNFCLVFEMMHFCFPFRTQLTQNEEPILFLTSLLRIINGLSQLVLT